MSTTPSPRRRSQAVAAALLFVAVLGVCALSLIRNRPLAFHFLPDEWYERAVNLRLYGTLGVADEPRTFRPPGYAAFVAGVLALLPTPPAPERVEVAQDPEVLRGLYGARGPAAVYWTQAVVLAAAAALLFLWATHFVPRVPAFLAGLLFGANPYSVILASAVHYEVLHLFGLVASGLLLQRAAASPSRPFRAALPAGLCWGLTTLIRPVTLILPPFALVAFYFTFGRRWRPALLAAAGLCLGMAGAIAPWTWRNFALTGRLIPVNSQAWVALWASTVEQLQRDPDHLRWQALWTSPASLEVQSRVRPRPFPRYPDDTRFNIPIEDAFRSQAFRNLREDPRIYLHNVGVNVLTLGLDMDTALIKVFGYVQEHEVERMPRGWFLPGHPQDFHASGHARSFAAYMRLLAVLAAGGALGALARRDAAVLVPGLACCCVFAAHALTWMDLRYYYVKLPFAMLFAVLGIHEASRLALRLPGLRRSIPVSLPLLAAVAAWGLGLTLVVLAPLRH
jgi:hypothetical protein